MFDNEYLNQLKKLSDTASKQAKTQIEMLDVTLKEVLLKVNDNEKPDMEKLIAMTTKSINLAKKGKADAASEIIKQFKDGRKSSKKNV